MAGQAVFGIFSTRQGVEDAVTALKTANFRGSDISILAPDNLGDFRDIATVRRSKAPEGAVVGVIIGACAGFVLGWFAGVGAFGVPHDALVLAAGPVMTALAGMGILGVIGGIVGAIAGGGRPEFEARRSETRLRKGGILLSVHADNNSWSTRAKEILKQAGGEKIATVSERRAA